jgi:hypothetical protein
MRKADQKRRDRRRRGLSAQDVLERGDRRRASRTANNSVVKTASADEAERPRPRRGISLLPEADIPHLSRISL